MRCSAWSLRPARIRPTDAPSPSGSRRKCADKRERKLGLEPDVVGASACRASRSVDAGRLRAHAGPHRAVRGIPCGVVVRSGRFNACTGRTVGSRAGAAVGDGPRRGPVPLSGDGGIGLRAPAEPSHGMLSSRRHRRTPHRRAQGDHTAAARQRYVPPRAPGFLVDAPQNFPGSSDFNSSRPRKTRIHRGKIGNLSTSSLDGRS